jgi:hypothetical protein
MKDRYFNKLEFQQVEALININPLEAKVRFEEYINKYPKDYSGYVRYAGVLIILEEMDEAEKVLEYVSKIYTKDNAFLSNNLKIELFERNLICTKFKLLSYKGDFENLYNLYLENLYNLYVEKLSKVDYANLNNMIFYCKKKLGKLECYSRDCSSYLFRQIIEYDEDDLLDHVKKHLVDFNSDVVNPNKNIFSSNFPLKQIIEEVKKYIPSNKRLCEGFYQDSYIFKYNACGREKDKVTDYFKVICFHNTENIITLCPVSQGKDLPYIDLNYLILEDDKCKVKKISQIDKFNRRYNIK